MGSILLRVRPAGPVSRTIDFILTPICFLFTLLQGVPRRTYFWNSREVLKYELIHLNSLTMVRCPADKSVPGMGVQYVVLEPDGHSETWHLGWISLTDGSAKISRVPFSGPLRRIIGPYDVRFFGIDTEGHQLRLKNIGGGITGDKQFKTLPLSE